MFYISISTTHSNLLVTLHLICWSPCQWEEQHCLTCLLVSIFEVYRKLCPLCTIVQSLYYGGSKAFEVLGICTLNCRFHLSCKYIYSNAGIGFCSTCPTVLIEFDGFGPMENLRGSKLLYLGHVVEKDIDKYNGYLKIIYLIEVI